MDQNISPPQPPDSTSLPAYRNPQLSISDRVADLLARMTLEEKIGQMLCIWDERAAMMFDEDGTPNFAKMKSHLGNGIGQIARISDIQGGLGPREMAELSNRLQSFFIEETRLGIPVIFHEECLHGLAARDATSYPQPIGLAATFNPALIENIYTAIAEDTRLRGAHQALTPVLDVARDARWGRVEETFGEDPYLVSQMAIAAVKGFQGDGSYQGQPRVLATLKHFAAHGAPESGTNCGPVNVSERELRDVFLQPFKTVIEKSQPASIMASYNEIDGIPSHANQWLLRTVLRDEWGFAGFIVSDYFAITELFHKEETVSHRVARDKREAARLALKAGVNIELPDPSSYPHLSELVRSGEVQESEIDALVAVMLGYKFKLGLFDSPYVDPDKIDNEKKLAEDRPLALQAAEETITLLKNDDDLLPLSAEKIQTLAVIGPNADRVLLGGYSGIPKYYTSVLAGIKKKVGEKIKVHYSEGCKITVGGSWNDDEVIFSDPEADRQSIKAAVAVAEKADVVILALGGNEQTSREAWGKAHMGDRPSLALIGRQNELVAAICATGKPVVILLFNGRPLAINAIAADVPAILECWYLGQETGDAVANVLFGDANPSGKLPISFPRSAGHIPCFYNHKPSARRGYLQDDVRPLYPFGFGLSYTTFEMSNLRLEETRISSTATTEAFIDLENTGTRSGQAVVQLYIRDMVSSVTRPVKELKGFRKVLLQPGEKITVALSIGPEELAFTNIDKEYIVEAGDFEIMVGSSSRDEDLQKVRLHVHEGE